jgi:hypothetical protein
MELGEFVSFSMEILGSWSGDIEIQFSPDGGLNWYTQFLRSTGLMSPAPGLPVISSAAVSNGVYKPVCVGGYTHLRVRAKSILSGSANITLTRAITPGNYVFGNMAMTQNILLSSGNTSSVNLSSGASFVGTSEITYGISTIQIVFISNQQCTVQVQQSIDNINWDIVDTWMVLAGIGDARPITSAAPYFRVVVTNNGSAVTTYFRLATGMTPVLAVLPRALTSLGNLKVAVQENLTTALNYYACSHLGGITATDSGATNPIFLIVNPSTSTKNIAMIQRIVGETVANVSVTFSLFQDPVVTSSGTPEVITVISQAVQTVVQGKCYTLPTISSVGSLVDQIPMGQNVAAVIVTDSPQLSLAPGHSWLIAANPSSNNRVVNFSVKWSEQ